MHFEPVAYFKGAASLRALAPRQGVFSADSSGVLVFESGKGYEQALRDLEGFERIWIIYHFHLNTNWRPTVRPPVPPVDQDRVGVFASRSPYRPNPIGMSCVRLIAVDGLHVSVAETDLLDGTPILDIKPYIPSADAFPHAASGWVERQQSQAWVLTIGPEAMAQMNWVSERAGYAIERLVRVQLGHNPLDPSRKRIQFLEPQQAVLSCRTWRVYFSYNKTTFQIEVQKVGSGYTPSELFDNPDDRYHDKEFHREFCKSFPAIF